MKTSLCVITAALGAAAWFAQERPSPSDGLQAIEVCELDWRAAEGFPAGVFAARATPESKGFSVDFLRFPAGTRVPPHWHGANQVATVLSGRLVIGGDVLDPGKEVGPGGHFRIAARTPHWTWAKEDSVIQIAGDGPHDLHWVPKP